MAEKGFGVKEVNLIGASGTPTITSPNNLNLNANNVAISTNVSIGGTLSVTGNVSVGGTLTYEDVTSIDSVGIITARSGIDVDDFISVGSNIHLGNAGVVTATSFSGGSLQATTGTFSGNISGNQGAFGGNISGPLLSITGDTGDDGIILINSAGGTNSDFSRIRQVISDDSFRIENKASGSYESLFEGTGNAGVKLYFAGTQKLETTGTGIASPNISVSGVGTFSTRIDTNGVTLGTNSTTFAAKFADDAVANFGTDNDLKISHDDNDATIVNSKGSLRLQNNTYIVLEEIDGTNMLRCDGGGAVNLYFNGGSPKLVTASHGVVITGVATATTFSGSGASLTNLPSAQLTGALPALDGSALTGVTASGTGIIIRHDGSVVGTASSINFSTNLDVSAISAGIVTVTASGGGGDKIEEGDTKVETVDSGDAADAYVTTEVNGTEEIRTIGGQTTVKYLRVGSAWNMANSTGTGIALSYSNTHDLIKGNSSGGLDILHSTSVELGQNGSPNYKYATITNSSAIFRTTNTERFRIDASGIQVGQNAVSVGATITIGGNATFAGIVTATTFSGALASSNLTGALPALDGSALTGVANTDVIFPDKVSFSDSAAGSINIGLSSDLQIYHNTNSFIDNTTNNNLNIRNTGNGSIQIKPSTAGVKLFHGDSEKLETNASGVTVTGNIVGTSFTASGPTGQTAFVNQHAVGVGSTTTTGKFAGVGTDAGTIVFDVTKSTLEFYNGNIWVPTSSTVPSITSVSGNIIVSNASTLTLAGGGFGAANLVVKFVQSSDSIDTSTTVTPTSSSAASVAVPAAVYNNVTAGNTVTITVTNSDGLESAGATKDAVALPSGGTVSTSGNYRIHTFTSSGTFVNTLADLSVEYLSSLVVVLVELVMLMPMHMEEAVVLVDIEQTSLVKLLVEVHLLRLHYLYPLEIKQ